jgi:phosphoribosylformimino-5-aminoimidazole carboxamide ribotide isomerase
LKVIPVIDVLNNVVVHAVKGNRKEYRPLKSVFTTSVVPFEVAAVFKRQGFYELYLADLDAILGNTPNFDLYACLVQMGFTLMVDAGVRDLVTVKKLRDVGVSKIIIGTETLPNTDFVKVAIQQIGAEHIIVSFDMKAGKILTPPGFGASTEVFELFRTFGDMGVLEFILLDLSRVGSSEGVNIELLKQILTITDNGVYVGGGVRGVEDLLSLKQLGVLGVLLATTLHSGKISGNVLDRAGLF